MRKCENILAPACSSGSGSGCIGSQSGVNVVGIRSETAPFVGIGSPPGSFLKGASGTARWDRHSVTTVLLSCLFATAFLAPQGSASPRQLDRDGDEPDALRGGRHLRLGTCPSMEGPLRRRLLTVEAFDDPAFHDGVLPLAEAHHQSFLGERWPGGLASRSSP